MNSIPRTWDSTPEEQKKRHPGNNTTMATGVLFREDNPYVVDRVLTETPADFDSNPIKPGDRLVAVNGNRSRPEHQPGTVFLIGHSAQRGSPEICKSRQSRTIRCKVAYHLYGRNQKFSVHRMGRRQQRIRRERVQRQPWRMCICVICLHVLWKTS